MTPETIEALQAAKVPWVAGMLAYTDEVLPNGASRTWRLDEYELERMALSDIPYLPDPATFYLCLAELARRVGLDPSQGVAWARDEGGWVLQGAKGIHWFLDQTSPVGGVWTCLPGIAVPDPLFALTLALKATAPKSFAELAALGGDEPCSALAGKPKGTT